MTVEGLCSDTGPGRREDWVGFGPEGSLGGVLSVPLPRGRAPTTIRRVVDQPRPVHRTLLGWRGSKSQRRTGALTESFQPSYSPLSPYYSIGTSDVFIHTGFFLLRLPLVVPSSFPFYFYFYFLPLYETRFMSFHLKRTNGIVRT